MARIFMTGFEDGSVNYSGMTPVNTSASTVQKRTGSYAAYMSNASQTSDFSFPLASSPSSVYLRVGVFVTSWGATEQAAIARFIDSNSAALMYVCTTPVTRHIGLYSGYSLLVQGPTSVALNEWNCIEIFMEVADAGQCVVKLNGVTQFTYSGDTKIGTSTAISQIQFAWNVTNTGGHTQYIDDIAINDTTGSVNNSWIGQGGIRPVLVNADGTVTGLTPSTGTDNYALVDEVPASDTDYVSGSTPDDYDLYTVDTSGMPASYTVSAVKWIARAKVTEDAANITPVIRSESTTEQQSDIALSTSFVVKELIMDTDPIDDAAWTKTKIDALEIGAAVG